MKTIVLNPFTIDPDVHSSEHKLDGFEPTLTVQADKEQSDINYIVKQFGLTQSLPYGMAVPEYADYSDIPNDYHAAMNFIRDSDDGFMQLDASVRSRFDNDPGAFLDFINDPANQDEAIKLGVAFDTRPPEPPQPLVDGGDGGGQA